MKKITIYYYSGDNGIVNTAIKINGVSPIGEKIRLIADGKKIITNGDRRVRAIEVDEAETVNWYEVDANPNEYYERASSGYKELLDIVTGAETE